MGQLEGHLASIEIYADSSSAGRTMKIILHKLKWFFKNLNPSLIKIRWIEGKCSNISPCCRIFFILRAAIRVLYGLNREGDWYFRLKIKRVNAGYVPCPYHLFRRFEPTINFCGLPNAIKRGHVCICGLEQTRTKK